MRATIQDVRAANLCGAGLREWLKRHGFELSAFLKEGLTVEQLEATDGFGQLVASKARERHKVTNG